MILPIVAFAVPAQKNEPANMQRPGPVVPMKDEQEHQRYRIRLMPAMLVMESYGFDILKGNKAEYTDLKARYPFFQKRYKKR